VADISGCIGGSFVGVADISGCTGGSRYTHVLVWLMLVVNLGLRPPTAGRTGDLVKFYFEHAYWQQGPINGPCCCCACMNKSL